VIPITLAVITALMSSSALADPYAMELVRSGLATATAQRVKAGRERLEVSTLRITEAGRGALAMAER
jgi:hypothetical protein